MRIDDGSPLFNRAFPLAWCQITPPKDPKLSSELSDRLSASIRSSIERGLVDPETIADAAVAALRT